MEAEQFLDNDLKGTYQVYDETGVTLITGIEHSEICRIMDEVLPLCGVVVTLCDKAELDKATLHGDLVIYCKVCERGHFA